MADDWIKMRENLHEQPEVLQMASSLETRPEHIVGYCHRFWGWVSRNVSPQDRDNCPGGCVTGVPLVSVESVLNLPGFLEMMCEVGWLKYEPANGKHIITVPKMDNHLSETAKKRALDTQKKRKQREKPVPPVSRKKRDKKGTREEKNREEKITNRYRYSTAQVANTDFVKAFETFAAFVGSELGRPLDDIRAEVLLAECTRVGELKATKDLLFSVAVNSTNLKDSDNDFSKQQSRNKTPKKTEAELIAELAKRPTQKLVKGTDP